VSEKPTQVSEQTARGVLTVTWGVNRWAMVDFGGRSSQRQVRSWREFAALLSAAGVTADEAEREGRLLWSRRPSDQGAETSRPYGELWRATGLPAWGMGLILLAVLIAAVVSWYLLGPAVFRHRSGG
jgi:hypothetical protein